MAIIRRGDWDPFRELYGLQHQISDLFDWSYGREVPDAVNRPERSWMPAVEVVEEEKEYQIKTEVPGMTKEDLKIDVDGNVLTISGEKKEEKKEGKGKKQRVCEICYGKFQRSFTLPDVADSTKIKAAFKDGVLAITIPKKKEAAPKKIDIAIE